MGCTFFALEIVWYRMLAPILGGTTFTFGAILGVIFIVGRFIYRAEYLKDPDSRSLGFGMTFIPSVVLLIWTLVVCIRNLL